jgi:hypothetical protein
VVRRENLDSAKVYLDEIGRVIVRASGIAPKLSIYAKMNRPETTRWGSTWSVPWCRSSERGDANTAASHLFTRVLWER